MSSGVKTYSLTVLPNQDYLGLWSFYFLAKAWFFVRGVIPFDWVWNLAFFAFLLIPYPAQWHNSRAIRGVREGINFTLGLLLLWHDTWLPPLSYALHFFWISGLPVKGYLFRFLTGLAQPLALGGLFVGFGVIYILRSRAHLAPVVMLVFFLLGVQKLGEGSIAPLDRQVGEFYAQQTEHPVRFTQSFKTRPDFDVIILHVCSLSWDDLQAAKLEHHPFLKNFDILFTRFNTVTTHSTPSALRLLRASEGQIPHGALYLPASAAPPIFKSLRLLGYHTYTAFDHDGLYSSMAATLQKYGETETALRVDDLPVAEVGFDGSVIRDNYAVLDRWWTLRQQSAEPRATLYLNIISLHGGSHRVNERGWWKHNRIDLYRDSFDALARDLERFEARVNQSGRKAVVFFIPEHGLSLRGSRIQPPDLREIPLPAITLVPAGVKLLGVRGKPVGAGPLLVRKPVSDRAWAEILAALLDQPVIDNKPATLERLVANITETPFLSENEKALVLEYKGAYYLKMTGGAWSKLPADVAFAPSVEMP